MTSKKPADAAPEEMSFEEALDRLETIVEELEGGSLALEQSLRHYEEGMKLSKRLAKQLDEAEKAIEKLVEQGAEEAPPEGGPEPAGGRRRKPGTAPMTLEPQGSDENELPF